MYTVSKSAAPGGRLRRKLFLAAVATLSVAALPVSSAAAAVPPSIPRVGYSGHAFATFASVAGAVRSGPSSISALGCGPRAGTRIGNTAAGVNRAGLLHGATLATTGDTQTSPDRVATTARAQSVTLPGALHATGVSAVSISFHNSVGYGTSSAGTSLASLTFGSTVIPVAAHPAPNTTITLPGLGTLVLNQQHTTITPTSASITVIAMHLTVTTGPQTGANILVGYAYSALTAPTTGFVSGLAYGTQAHVNTLIGSGPSFSVLLPCGGTNGHLVTNTGAGVTVPPYVTSGAVTTTGRGTSDATTATGQTTSTVATANLINGVIKATVVKADAHATKTNGQTTLTDTGTGFGSINVLGHPLQHVQPNTVKQIPGLGTLYLRREIRTANSIEIRMIELVTTTNPYGLPAGADIKIAAAQVAIQ